MLTTIRRYVRAFGLALRFTLRGEKPPLLQVRERYPQLAAWWEQTAQLTAAVERAAQAHHLDAETLKVHVDKRDISMATILATVKYHAEREYPYLLAHNDQYDQMTLQALNMNDRYWVMRLAESVDPPLKTRVEALSFHLEQLPIQNSQQV